MVYYLIMKYDKLKLIREQLDQKLLSISGLKKDSIPVGGWVKAIRTSLGMNTRQMAERLGVRKQRISKIEKDEISGNLTIETLRKAAQALDCVFVYALVPKASLEETVQNKAKAIVVKRMERLEQSMFLESQSLEKEQQKKATSDAVDKLLRQAPSSIWEAE